jgi:integrase
MTTGDGADRKPKAGATVIRNYGVLAAILDEAVKDRRLLSNPARGVNLPRKAKKAHTYLSREQVHLMAPESKYPTLVLVLAYSGLRWGEAIGPRVKDLDVLKRRFLVLKRRFLVLKRRFLVLERRFLVTENAVEVGSRIVVGTPKNHERRSVPFPRFLVEMLAQQCAGKHRDGLLFAGVDGGYMRSARVHEHNMSWFAGAVKRSGIPRITPHDLRHSAASFAVSAGANVKAVQKMLGHSSAAMTLDVYAHLFDDDLDAVADALDVLTMDVRNIRRG